jgi:DNA-binding beta-propeller fold protein YncE
MDLFGTNWVTGTIAGTALNFGFNNGLDKNASFAFPFGIARHGSGRMYVADFGNNAIRQVSPSGAHWMTSTVAGFSGTTGTNDGSAAVAKFNSPNGIAVDASETLYVADQYNNTIRKLTLAGGSWTVSTLAGAPAQAGTNDGPASTARFYRPWGLVLDPAGNLFIVDSFNQTIRKGTVQTVPPPTLGIFRAASQVVLVWPGAASNFVLQASAALDGAAAWSPLTNGVVSSGGYYFFTNSLGGSSWFFRLRGL